jgi:hypothetical protein
MSEPRARYARNRRIFLVLFLFSGLAATTLGVLSILALWSPGASVPASSAAAGSGRIALACASVSCLACLAALAGFMVAAVRLSRLRAPPGKRSTVERERLAAWAEVLETRFSAEELRTLCFNLRVDYEDLPGAGKAAKAAALLWHLASAQRLGELAEAVARVRPDIPWDGLAGG